MKQIRKLRDFRVAVLCTDGVEENELIWPIKALEDAGATVTLISPKEATVQAWNHKHEGNCFDVDLNVQEAEPEEFDAVVLPGGAMNGDELRTDRDSIEFVRHIHQEGKPIAAICHGAWILAEAKLVHHKKLTSTHSLKTDLVNAGAEWIDEAAVIDARDGGLITSRTVDDLEEFNEAMLKLFSRAAHKLDLEKKANAGPSMRSRAGTFTPGGLLE